MRIIILCCLLTFVPLTWQVDDGWFSPVLAIILKFSNTGSSCIRGWVGKELGWDGWWQKLKKEARGHNSGVYST